MKVDFITSTYSTNEVLRARLRKEALPEGFVVMTEYQSAGKGQQGNSWESEKGKNLLLSLVLYPTTVAVEKQFIISQLVSIGIKEVLDTYTSDITIKWPNDIYWQDKKLAGILIENSLQGAKIKNSVIGIGLNVNQQEFTSDAPNPVSLCQILGKNVDRMLLLERLHHKIMSLHAEHDPKAIASQYENALYRKDGFFHFKSGDNTFQARISSVCPDGQLILETLEGTKHGFYFKEVEYVHQF